MLFKHCTTIQNRFADMDAFGHINNAKFLTYLEEARIKYIDDIIHWKYEWSKQAIILAHAEIEFKIPALYKDSIKVYTACSHLGNKSFTLEYKMVKNENDSEIILATALTTIVMYDYENHSTIPVPDDWKTAIINYEKI